MPIDLIPALVAFALATSITPGPNNLMLMASGANFGVRRSVPHMLGIGIGFAFLIVMVGVGLAQLFDALPYSYHVLTAASVTYLIWLAWKTATAASPTRDAPDGQPMTFLQAAAFQWVNPKAWAMALYAITAYAPDRALSEILTVAAIFGAINLPSVSLWAALGQQMARFLTNPNRRVTFNRAMAALLIGSLYPLVLH